MSAKPAGLAARCLDHFFFLRPLLLVPAATLFLIGRWEAVRSAAGPTGAREAGIVFATLAAALIATHAANQLADRDSDAANAKLPLLSEGLVEPRTARWFAAAGVCLFFGLLVAVPTPLVPLELAALGLGIAYAVPPFCLKRRAGLDLAANAVGYGGVAYLLGRGTVAAGFTAEALAHAAPWMLAVGGVFAATTVVDEPGDRAAGARTLAVVLGPDRTRYVYPLLLVLAAVAAARVGSQAALLLCGASLIAALAALLRRRDDADHLAFQIGAALPVAYAALREPRFGAALLALGIAARAYYAHRFGRAYPHVGAPSRRVSRGALGPGRERS